MNKIGIFFGTDSGSTRLIAKLIYKRLGDDIADKPLNINRVEMADIMQYDAIILGTPTYGAGQLPGRNTGMQSDSWNEILPVLSFENFTGKTVALYGLGDQEKYTHTFVNGLFYLHEVLKHQGANIVGYWPTEGYEFEASRAIVDNRFMGLALDQQRQRLLTEERLDKWLELIKPALLENPAAPSQALSA